MQTSIRYCVQSAEAFEAEMVRGQRQGRVTDRGKEQSGAYPSAMFARAHKLASDGAHLIHEGGDGVQSQVRRGGGPRALSASAIAYRKHTLVFVKPAAGSLFQRVFLGQLLQPVIVETVKGRNPFSNDKPGIRYFSHSSDFPGSATYAHEPGTVKTVSAFAIYGKVDGYTNVVLAVDDGLLDSFDVADDELDSMEGIINE
jgi:hypothetical protein